MTKNWLRVKDLQRRYGVSRTTIDNWRKTNLLPAPVSIGPNTVGWPAEVIEQFEKQRARRAS